MFDNFKNLAGLMGQAKQMKEQMEQLQAELAKRTVSADAGAGAVRVIMNGRFEVVDIKIDRAMIATLAGQGQDADVDMIEQLITSAVNAAMEKAQLMAKQEMAKLTGGLNIPGMDQLMNE